MWADSEDILDLETTPEMMRAAELMSNAGDMIAEETLPLKRLEAMCAFKCFDSIRDAWSMSASQKSSVMECVERCEEPMQAVADVLEEERARMLESTTDCLEKCRENDEDCVNRCISQSITEDRIGSMMSRVRSRILGYKYS